MRLAVLRKMTTDEPASEDRSLILSPESFRQVLLLAAGQGDASRYAFISELSESALLRLEVQDDQAKRADNSVRHPGCDHRV